MAKRINNLLINRNLELYNQIHPTKNGNFDFSKTTYKSGKKIWWLCKKGHELEAIIRDKTNGVGCKKCNNNHTSKVERKFYYFLQLIFNKAINSHFFKNEKTGRNVEVDIYIPEINLAIEYDGSRFHKKDDVIKRDLLKNDFLKKEKINLIRIRENDIPKIYDIEFRHYYKCDDSFESVLLDILKYISNNFVLSKVQKEKLNEILKIDFSNHIIPKEFYIYPCKDNSLLDKNPKLASQWDKKLNGSLRPEFFSEFSHKKIWWLCEKGHSWDASISNRSGGGNCPYCLNKKVCIDNCLATLNKEISKEWNIVKNGNLTPFDVTCGSDKVVWWICGNNHEWLSQIKYRTSGYGCIKCKNKKISIKKTKSVKQIDAINFKTIEIFDSLALAAFKFNTTIKSIINCCNKKQKTTAGYYWEFDD